MKHFRTPTLAILAGACLSLLGTNALAESTYGYNAAGTGVTGVAANARLNLVINVPKLILLRVGSSGATVDTLTWNSGITWATAPATLTDGDNQATNWDGTAPGTGTTANPADISAFAWTNSSGGGSLAYDAAAFGAGGPTLGDITVTSASGFGLVHPDPSPLAATSAGPTVFARNTLATGSWSFALGGTPAAWTAGQYTSQITYTATSL